MAGRQRKAGLDYFELDCHMDDKIRLIQAEFGLKGFAIVVKLYQWIYGQFGYYCEWSADGDSLLLFMSDNGVSSCEEKNLIQEVVFACIRRNIFSERLYKEYSVLTSVGVQKRYLNAVSRRESVNLIKEYLLISVPKNIRNVNINSINVDINAKNVDRNSQSKGKESKRYICAPESHECDAQKIENETSIDKESALKKNFEIIYKIYPKKVGKTVAFANYKQWVSAKGKDVSGTRHRLTDRQIYLAVRKYVRQQEEAGTEMQYWKNFDTLMGRQLLDYVDLEEGKK